MGNLYTSTTFMEHNSHPDYKYEMDAPTHEHDGINPSCGDELTLQLRVENNVIEEASFTGHGCAISQASADIMADLITGETVEEARRPGRALPRHDPRREALRGGPGRPGRSRPAPGHLAHARPRQMRRARPGAPSTACSRGKLTSSVCSESKVFDCRAAQYGRLCFPNEHEHTKSARPAPRLSFTTRPDANTGVFHSTKRPAAGPRARQAMRQAPFC